jgi:DNA-binding MarR family transcriptional regulator
MAPSGLRVTQYSLLSVLAHDGPLRITDLAARLLLDRTALSRNLDPLIERAFVAVTAGRDARTRDVALMAKGASALKRAEPHWKRAQEEVARRVGKPKLDALITILGELESLHPHHEDEVAD